MDKSNQIEFPLVDNMDFVQELRITVDRYFETNKISKSGNTNLAFKSIFMLSLYLAPYFIMIFGELHSMVGILLCWILMGMGKAGVGMGIMHDANHRSFSERKSINNWLSNTLYLLGGFPPTWQHQHNTMHHAYTNIDGFDEDISPGAFLRISPHKPLYKIHKVQYIYAWVLYGLMTILWITVKDFRQLARYLKTGVSLGNKSRTWQLYSKLIFSKIIYYSVFLILPIIVLQMSWLWVLLFFFSMHFIAGLILGVIFQCAHVVPNTKFPLPDKNGKMESNWIVHQLYTTTDFAPKNKILSWLIGGLNYQVEHHLFPNISHVHYSKIAPLVEKTARKYNLPYNVQAGFFRAIQEHGKMLKILGREKIIS